MSAEPQGPLEDSFCRPRTELGHGFTDLKAMANSPCYEDAERESMATRQQLEKAFLSGWDVSNALLGLVVAEM
jgi:hypothetical protein